MHKNNPNVSVPPIGPGDAQSTGHVRGQGQPGANRPPGPLGPQQQAQPPKPMGGPMPPPGQPSMNGPKKEPDGDLNPPLNPPSSTPTLTSLLSGAPPMNPQRPPTASAPVPSLGPPQQQLAPGSMSDLHFDMTDVFNMAGDFDFGTNSLDMDFYLDTASVHDGSSLDMK
jgi:hypothetical protein